ncbi:NADP-dependent oxidoreductase [Psychromicrobium lacuslunae]|uniref:NADPH:quinone reductase n=1 Tax=Psychromicrobium lacuslunae TaxID=1618207 RepID=A0A0D4BWS9_9MICC|nr:NADP-dependent oxidoreductase [Psychromicrobium lacuslunae]AJT40556.1 NADPH:quinone reductase [Psychromicrobium lacuslunae]
MTESSMLAIVQHRAGDAETLEQQRVPRPKPSGGEILVRVCATALNPVDWKSRERGFLPDGSAPPFTLGWDVSGVVEEVADGVTLFAPGDEVFGMPSFPHAGSAHAEYLVAPARHFASKPTALSHQQAAALPLAVLTAWQALVETAGIQTGQRVLIPAAAGGVGHLAVQIAKAHGAYVIGTASTAKHPLLRELGVDEAIDYRQVDATQTVREVDIVLDTLGGNNGLASLDTLKPGGILVSLLPLEPETQELAAQRGIRAIRLMVTPDRDGLREVAALVEAEKLKPVIDSVFPLSEIKRAYQRGETNRASGKIVVVPGS